MIKEKEINIRINIQALDNGIKPVAIGRF